jgi:cytochrome b6
VPQHRHSMWYYFGGMTLFLFGMQAVTGILLTLYYRANPEQAHESVHFIMSEVSFGWLIRAIHGWTANLIVLVAGVHMVSAFFLRSYRRPREATWMTGALMFFLFLGFGFSGYLLPWNELSLFATKVGTDIPGTVPVIGGFVRHLLRGGDMVTGATLARFYGIHIAILPAIFTMVLGVHLYLVQRHGMSVPIGVEEKLGGKPAKGLPFLPNFLLRDMVALLAGLAALLPEGDGFFVKLELGKKANLLGAAPPNLKPEWYFLAMFYTLKQLPGEFFGISWLHGETVGVLFFGLCAAVVVLLPLLDRKASRGLKSRVIPVIGVVAIVWLIVFTILGRVAR